MTHVSRDWKIGSVQASFRVFMVFFVGYTWPLSSFPKCSFVSEASVMTSCSHVVDLFFLGHTEC